MYTVKELFDLSHTRAGEELGKCIYPWEILDALGEIIRGIGHSLDSEDFAELKPEVWVHKAAAIAETAFLEAPCIVDAHAEVRHCAFIRGRALIGEGCIIGNSVEIKNAILFDGAQVNHFNYVGDSVLGYHSHMGAGAITSNVKLDSSLVTIRSKSGDIPTNLMKLGAMLGDYAEIGCNSVLNPGTIVGRCSAVYPLSHVRGCVPANHIYKDSDHIFPKR